MTLGEADLPEGSSQCGNARHGGRASLSREAGYSTPGTGRLNNQAEQASPK